MDLERRLRDFEFSINEYAAEPEKVVADAIAFAGMKPGDEHAMVRSILRCKYMAQRVEAVNWEPMCSPLVDGGRITGKIGSLVVSGTVSLGPKRIGVIMDLPRVGAPQEMTLHMIAPVIFTDDPWEGSPANSYGVDVAHRLLLDGYYGTMADNG